MAAVTGEPVSVIRGAIRQAAGKISTANGSAWPVMGVSNENLIKAMKLLGWHITAEWNDTAIEGHYTLDQFAKDHGNDGPFIVNVTGHYVAISHGEICDPFTCLPKDLFGGVLERGWYGGRKRKGSTWVRRWWKFEKARAQFD
jgi:hypothetical protein